jgi:hypothetical protein
VIAVLGVSRVKQDESQALPDSLGEVVVAEKGLGRTDAAVEVCDDPCVKEVRECAQDQPHHEKEQGPVRAVENEPCALRENDVRVTADLPDDQ